MAFDADSFTTVMPDLATPGWGRGQVESGLWDDDNMATIPSRSHIAAARSAAQPHWPAPLQTPAPAVALPRAPAPRARPTGSARRAPQPARRARPRPALATREDAAVRWQDPARLSARPRRRRSLLLPLAAVVTFLAVCVACIAAVLIVWSAQRELQAGSAGSGEPAEMTITVSAPEIPVSVAAPHGEIPIAVATANDGAGTPSAAADVTRSRPAARRHPRAARPHRAARRAAADVSAVDDILAAAARPRRRAPVPKVAVADAPEPGASGPQAKDTEAPVRRAVDEDEADRTDAAALAAGVYR